MKKMTVDFNMNCPFKQIMLHQVRSDMKSCRIVTTGGTSVSPTKNKTTKKDKKQQPKRNLCFDYHNVKAIGLSPVNPISLRQFSAINSKLEEPQLIVSYFLVYNIATNPIYKLVVDLLYIFNPTQ